MKPVSFLGNSLDEVRSFPDDARRDVGFQIDRLQRGLDPDDWKPMKTIGPGVRRLPGDLHRHARRRRLRPSCLPEEDADDTETRP
jgi:phage-related protein